MSENDSNDQSDRGLRSGLDRRHLLFGLAATGLGGCGTVPNWELHAEALRLLAQSEGPDRRPAFIADVAWTRQILWQQVLNLHKVPGADWDERIEYGQRLLKAVGGGVLFLPAGEYRLKEEILLEDRVVLRGEPFRAADATGVGVPRGTRLLFPAHRFGRIDEPFDHRDGFRRIRTRESSASRCGLVDLDLDHGRIEMRCPRYGPIGSQRLVVGCRLRHAVAIDESLPDLSIGQLRGQRFTDRGRAAVEVDGLFDVLVAGNSIEPSSGSVVQRGYVLDTRGGEPGRRDVVFDYDNRSGLLVNFFTAGGERFGRRWNGNRWNRPYSFRRGLLIRDNAVFSTGRPAIGFSGQGVVCERNSIRFRPGVVRHTVDGRKISLGSSTNGNRAIEARGHGWSILNNQFEVHSNRTEEGDYTLNDGEGILHEDHANSTVVGARAIGNVGNANISVYRVGAIDGLEVSGNELRLARAQRGRPFAIYVSALRGEHLNSCGGAAVHDNVVESGGILMRGRDAGENRITDNRCLDVPQELVNEASAELRGNVGFSVA